MFVDIQLQKSLKCLLFTFLFLASTIVHAQKIKVACIGNSVTYGHGIENRLNDSYPQQLQQLLGDSYLVGNFGHSGATMLKNGHKPFWEKPAFKKSKEFEPNIVIIHLGLNDQGNNNWPEHKNKFVADYIDMISVYQALPSKPKVLVCRMSPTFSGHHWFEEGMRENFKEIQNKIEEVASIANVQIIDLHEPLYRLPELFPDNIHPVKEGVKIIAQKIYSALTGDYGGLKLSMLYGEKMILQRDQPIVISGKANSNDEIAVSLNKSKANTDVSKNGNWSVTLPAMHAGGPYKLSIKSQHSNDINIDEVYIGEVWLASGQSNMDFEVKNMKLAPSVLKDSLNDNIHLFSFDPQVLKAGTFTDEELQQCNAANYFRSSGWSNTEGEVFENFSAVAYAFAYNLQKELKVPIGIICNAVGGSPIESWISRESMEAEHHSVDLLNDTWGNPMTHPWVAERKFENFGTSKKVDSPARHPYDPTLLFDAGVLPLTNYNIKGVIWYQGESNAQQIDLHSRLFYMLINDWRMHWDKPDLPFYYVQLSSINRPTWGQFRDSQRRLLTIPHTSMAVTSDIGHPTDVHPKQKWTVGKRLSNIALAKSYGKDIAYSGPVLDYVNVSKDKLVVHFKYSDGLKTIDNEALRDIQVAGEDRVFVSAQGNIENDKLVVWSEKIANPRYVRYGYSPFTDGNLINKHNLPASTFSNESSFPN